MSLDHLNVKIEQLIELKLHQIDTELMLKNDIFPIDVKVHF